MYDELIKRLRETSVDFGESDHVSVMMIEAANAIEDLITALTASNEVIAKNKSKWIPVTERLPDKYVSVWTYSKFGMLQDEYIGEYDGENYFARQTTHVTHWQPLPEPPKEET